MRIISIACHDVSACDHDKIGDALRDLVQYGSDIGQGTIKAIADRALNPRLADPKDAAQACGQPGVCTLSALCQPALPSIYRRPSWAPDG